MNSRDDEQSGDGPGIPLDTVFDLLAVRERRAMLYYLADHGSVPFDELAAAVAGRDADGETHSRVAVAQSHVHLPRCVDAGVVTIDDETEEAAYTGTPSLTAWLDWARGRDSPTYASDVSGTRAVESGGEPR
ncbi:helix-turn-helix transcriptional regulator [Halomarina salina]|uniref:Helix-turn-helix transcriptional regulator n=1 Tax=Halomarina salina TaxID=1872699 RepID=A0ABD5RQJ7_9EURY|nr:helix-turn-helix transcriptional regulator [Halomarina salina]